MSEVPPITSWQPPPDPPIVRKPSRAGLAVLIVAVGAIVAVIALTVPGRDGDGGPPIDAETALEGLTAYIDDEAGDDGFALPGDCRFADQDDVVDVVEEVAELRLDLADEDLVVVSGDANDGFVACIFGDDASIDDGITVAWFVDPRGRRFRSTDDDVDGDVTDGPEREHRGGTIESYCVEPDDGVPSCAAGWSANGLLVFVSVDSEDIEVEGAIASLEALLDPMIAALEDEA